jgi:hypothetical protein
MTTRRREHLSELLSNKAIVQVVLATFEANGHAWELAWVRRPGPQFRVADRGTEKFCWFSNYAIARGIFDACCEEAGQPTFRSHAQQGGAS